MAGAAENAHMEHSLLPATDARVPDNTLPRINRLIDGKTLHDVTRFIGVDPAFIDERIRELQREWDIERTLEVNAASVALAGLVLGVAVDRRFLAIPFIAAGFLLQHALQGWCPPLPILRRLGIRTSAEIHQEIIALKILRGDYLDRVEYPEDALAGARMWS
jgi:hypothetical protein